MSTATQRQQIAAALETVVAIGQAIREAGTKGLISGHLYAILMGHMSLSSYETAIRVLKNAGLVTESNHVLYWKGPNG